MKMVQYLPLHWRCISGQTPISTSHFHFVLISLATISYSKHKINFNCWMTLHLGIIQHLLIPHSSLVLHSRETLLLINDIIYCLNVMLGQVWDRIRMKVENNDIGESPNQISVVVFKKSLSTHILMVLITCVIYRKRAVILFIRRKDYLRVALRLPCCIRLISSRH